MQKRGALWGFITREPLKSTLFTPKFSGNSVTGWHFGERKVRVRREEEKGMGVKGG